MNLESRVYFEETRRAVFQGRTSTEVDSDEVGNSGSWEKAKNVAEAVSPCVGWSEAIESRGMAERTR